MKQSTAFKVESSFRSYYGKLFAALLRQYGSGHLNLIEDALQNAFYKAMKSWKSDRLPANPENWLFIVARNDLLNQMRRNSKIADAPGDNSVESASEQAVLSEDLRLKTVVYLASFEQFSTKVKVIFILKNIFGLHVKELAECTLMSEHAIYKLLKRAVKDFERTASNGAFDCAFESAGEKQIAIVEQILYAVFNMGFDSFSEKAMQTINEDLCLEALSLAKLLWNRYEPNSTRNLLALFCFHIARIPARIDNDSIVSFFEQDRSKWNADFIALGFHYLQKPGVQNRYHLEALIASKHMTNEINSPNHWQEIVLLYQLLLKLSNTPIVKLNLCYCLYKAGRQSEAKSLLLQIEKDLPAGHLYFSLVKAKILSAENGAVSQRLVRQVLGNVKQQIRREFILNNLV